MEREGLTPVPEEKGAITLFTFFEERGLIGGERGGVIGWVDRVVVEGVSEGGSEGGLIGCVRGWVDRVCQRVG